MSAKKEKQTGRIHLPSMDDVAQAAVIYVYVVGLVLGLAMFIYTSPVTDEMTDFHYKYTTGTDPLYTLSQNLQDSIFITQIAIQNWPIIYFIGLTLAAYAAALRERSGIP